jgi:chemotaxis protein methyltransferase CheR
MRTELAAAVLDRLAARIEAHTGLQFLPARRTDLGRALRRVALACGFGNQLRCAEWLLDGEWDRAKAEQCARHLTVGETYFFREPRGYKLLCDYALHKQRAAPGARLRLWSAGCCTGEEPYSMAIALREAVPGFDPARISILGTDLDEAKLRAAREALYGRWSFRRTDPALRAAYFTETAGRFALRPDIAARVRFAQLNLVQPVYPSPANGTDELDIIFCRNVLMYFSRSQAKQVIERLRACLVDGGWLVVNPSESSAELFAGFACIVQPDAILYQKRVGKGSEAPAVPRAAPVPVAPRDAPCVAGPALQAVAAYRGQSGQPRAGEGGATLRALGRAANAQPLDARLYQCAAEVALERGDYGRALEQLKRLLYLQPQSALANYLCAVSYLGQGRRAAGLHQLTVTEALLAMLPDDAPVPGTAGWQALGLRAAVHAWRARAA